MYVWIQPSEIVDVDIINGMVLTRSNRHVEMWSLVEGDLIPFHCTLSSFCIAENKYHTKLLSKSSN